MNQDDPEFISKTKRKAEAEGLQDLGAMLIELSPHQLNKLDIADELREAVRDAQRIGVSKHTALKRQRQYIGKLMRNIDPAPIRAALDALKAPSRAAVALQHLAEHWREKLVADDQHFTAFAEQFPEADVGQLRRMSRAARDEHDAQKPPKNFRELYRAIHELVIARSKREATEPAEEDSDE